MADETPAATHLLSQVPGPTERTPDFRRITPEMVLSFLRVENEPYAFDVVHPDSRATGLMQVGPSAKRDIETYYGQPVDLRDPSSNVAAGVLHMAFLNHSLNQVPGYAEADHNTQMEALYITYNNGEGIVKDQLGEEPLSQAALKKAFPTFYKKGGQIERLHTAMNDRRFLQTVADGPPEVFGAIDGTLRLAPGDTRRAINARLRLNDHELLPTTDPERLQDPSYATPDPLLFEQKAREGEEAFDQLRLAEDFRAGTGSEIGEDPLEEPFIAEDTLVDIATFGVAGVAKLGAKTINRTWRRMKAAERKRKSGVAGRERELLQKFGESQSGPALQLEKDIRTFIDQRMQKLTGDDEVTQQALAELRARKFPLAYFLQSKAGQAFNNVELRALEFTLDRSIEMVDEVVEAIAKGAISGVDAEHLFLAELGRAARLAVVAKGAHQTSGLAQRAIRPGQQETIDMILAVGGGRIPGATTQDLINKWRLLPNGKKPQRGFLEKLSTSKGLMWLNMTYLDGLLSNTVKTVARNLVGTHVHLFNRTLDTTYASLLPGSGVGMREAASMWQAYIASFWDSLALVPVLRNTFPKKAIEEGVIWESVRGEGLSRFGLNEVLHGAARKGYDGRPLLRNLMGHLAGTFSSRNAIDLADTWGRYFAYKMVLKRAQTRAAVKLKAQGRPQHEISTILQDIADNPSQFVEVDPFTGRLRTIRQSMTDFGEEVTFMKRLPGQIGRVVDDPLARGISPFLTNGVRMSQATLSHTPLPVALEIMNRVVGAATFGKFYSPTVTRLLGMGTREGIAMATSKMMTGMTYVMIGYQLAHNGQLLGNGPRNLERRRAWQNMHKGYQPRTYNYIHEDGSVSTLKLDEIPVFGNLLIAVADAYELSVIEDQEGFESASLALASIIAEASGASGLFEDFNLFMTALHSGEWEKWSARKLAQYMPKSALMKAWVNTVEGKRLQGDTEGFQQKVDEFKKQIPGWSGDLSPNRGFWGHEQMLPTGYLAQFWNPFVTTTTPHNAKEMRVMDEFQAQHMFPKAPDSFYEGIYLGHEATMYRRQVFGEAAIDGMTLADELVEIIDGYQEADLPDFQRPIGFNKPTPSIKALILEGAIQKRLDTANGMMLAHPTYGPPLLEKLEAKYRMTGVKISPETRERMEALFRQGKFKDAGEAVRKLFEFNPMPTDRPATQPLTLGN